MWAQYATPIGISLGKDVYRMNLVLLPLPRVGEGRGEGTERQRSALDLERQRQLAALAPLTRLRRHRTLRPNPAREVHG